MQITVSNSELAAVYKEAANILIEEEAHNARVLALLFAEQIALDLEQELAGVP
jgi:hypothetical protein